MTQIGEVVKFIINCRTTFSCSFNEVLDFKLQLDLLDFTCVVVRFDVVVADLKLCVAFAYCASLIFLGDRRCASL